MDDALYMTAEAAADALGVNVTTIYTYVSRGQIRSQREPGKRSRRYWRTDVMALVGGGDVLPDAPDLRRTLVESSAITLITPDGHYYRGKSALELAKTATLEEVASLLWQAPNHELFTHDLPRVPELGPGAHMSGELSPLQRAIALLFNVEQANPRAYDLSPQGYRRSGVDVLRCVAAAGLGARELSTEPMHRFMVRTLNAPESLAEVVRFFLVLAADHELDPTTYTVRAAANTGVTPYAASIAGLVSASGRRLTYGQGSSVARLLDEIESAADPREPILRRVREGERLPGFASRTYAQGDPRARTLLARLRETLGDHTLVKRTISAAEAAHEAVGAYVDFALPSQVLAHIVGLREQQGILLRIARVVGWIAHAMEQYHERDLVRPHVPYSGELPL